LNRTKKRKKQSFSNDPVKMMFLLSFLIPVIIYAGLFIGRGIFPGGSSLYLYSDMYHQYAPFLAEFRYKILHGEGLTYSWDIGMGTNFLTLYAYYCASPLNWLCILVPQSLLIDFMDFFIMIKGGLAALAFSYYVNQHYKRSDPIICVVSMFYACSGYWAAYCWCTMWLDCIVLLPLIMLGIERLVDKNSCTLYGVTLGLCIFTNYYISIMVCISCVLYFIFRLVLMEGPRKKQRIGNAVLHFVIYSGLAAGMAAVLLLPEIYTFSLSASADSTFPTVLSQYFPFVLMISRHMMGIPVTFGEKYPNVFCSVAVLFLLPLYVVSPRYTAKQKISRCLLLLIFLFSFNINVFDYIWHGFHYPNSLSCRQSFIYIFFVLLTAYEALISIRDYSMQQIAAAAGIACGLIFWFEQIYARDTSSYSNTYQYDFRVIYLSLIFIILYVILTTVVRKAKTTSYICLLLVFVTAISEASINMDLTGLSKTDRQNYLSDNNTLTSLVNTAKDMDSSFWRMEKIHGARTKNDGAWSHYPSISVFASTSSDGVTKLFQALGLESSMNEYNYSGSTALTNALFDVKYMISSEEVTNSPLLKLVTEEDDYYLYQNTQVLPVGYMVPSTLEDDWDTSSGANAIETQNSFASLAAGVDGLFESLGNYASESEVTVTVQKSGYLYFVVGSDKVSSVTLTYPDTGDSTTVSDLKDGNKIVDAGYVGAGTTVTISASQTMKLTAWLMDVDKLEQTVSTLKQNSLSVTSHTSTSISGTITVSQSGTFLLTIPYDGGWTIKVDGKEVEVDAWEDAFLSTELSAGTHTIELTYWPKYLTAGILVSLISIFLVIALFCIKRRISKGQIRRLPEPVERFFLDSDLVVDTDNKRKDEIKE
jgi:uncharacterized membrane protein YfhO